MNSSKRLLRRFYTIILAVFAVLCLLPGQPSATAAESSGPLPVRVGFFKHERYHEIRIDSSRSGYGYDFLQMIAPYADIKYEYFGYVKSWSEMQAMLDRGEIDLLTMMDDSPERREKYDFASMNIGLSATTVITTRDNTQIIGGDPSSMQGARVGFIKDSSRGESFDRHAKAQGISYIPVYFESLDELRHALFDKKVDMIAVSDFFPITHELRIVDDFDKVPFYAVVKKGNKELLQRLNKGIFALSSAEPAWRENLRNNYYGPQNNSAGFTLTAEEKEVINRINKGRPLKILINPDRFPYAYNKNGKAQGIFYDLLEMAAKQIGFKYEMLILNSTQEYNDATIAGIPDIIFDSPNTLFSAEEKGYNSTRAYYHGNFSVVRRKNNLAIKTVAVKKGALNMNPVYRNMYGTSIPIPFDSVEECIQAVRDGKADCCYVYTYTAADYVARDTTGILEYTPIRGNFTSFRIAVRKGIDPAFYAILNRFALSVTDNTMRTLITLNRKQDPETVLTLIHRHPLMSASALALIGILAASVFISHQRRQKEAALSEELREALAQANAASRAKTNFLNNMSHDIRTPMNAIIGFTDLAIKDNDDREQSLEHLQKIRTSSSHLLSLINDVLDMSRIESGKISINQQPISLPTITRDIYNMVLTDARAKQLKLDFSCDLQDEYVRGDLLRLNQIILNCLGNSIKFTPENGTVSFSVHQTTAAKNGEAQYEFRISDNGIGISPQFLPHIFDPFERERTSTVSGIQGTGLGMTICKNLVELMGGTISVDSEQNNGTQIIITLTMPLAGDDEIAALRAAGTAAAEPAAGKPDSIPPEKVSLDGIRVLLAEDNELNQEIACAILEQAGASVETAGNGRIALEKVKASQPGFYDVILMDIQMPEMDGYEATRCIRKLPEPELADIPIVAMTANAFEEDKKQAYAAGMNAHIAKPIDLSVFFSTLREILQK
ncbi:MAG: transporter substrate-binding domain-containing protein [Selenomonadaceae bacterium]|nr:transporter substrate-binding domain-containing protein [Selenomonadaceae bacterium]